MKTYRICVFVVFGVCVIRAQQGGKQLLPGEFDIYNQIVTDINQRNFTRALADIEVWRQKFPGSAYRDSGAAMEVQALAESNQPAKCLDAVSALMKRGLETVFSGPEGQATMIRLLYSAAWAVSHLADPTAEEMAAGESAARQLMDYDKQLPGASPEQWAQARADIKAKASDALFYLAMLPGSRPMAAKPPDCAAAEAGYEKALGTYPERTVLSYELGRALNCQVREAPDKLFAAVFEFERAAVVDPKLGNPNGDAGKVRSFADSAYVRVHGSDEGLDGLKELVKQSALPPAGFRFPTAAEVAEQKRVEFEKSNPQLAMWMKIKAALVDPNGEAFFEGQMKDTSMPPLRGLLVEAKPACKPRELLVAIPLPDGSKPAGAEIRLKLDKPLAGKPAAGAELQWEGVARAFTLEPFLLTMEVAKLQGLKAEGCVAGKK